MKKRTTEEILNELLALRGICDDAEIAEFLSERPQRAHDPFLLLNMNEASDLILSEIEAGTRICIYGDYDADGVTSVCILESFLRNLTEEVFHYIPSRFTDGYGLNKDAILAIKDKGAGLIITVDCGSVSRDEVEYAKSLGLRMVVTDHHTIDKVKADCILINPKQSGCSYPFKDLAGCGVAFKLAQAIRIRTGLPRELLNDCLDLVAIGTVADIVSLRDENRTLVKYGLHKINQGDRMPLRKLLEGISLANVSSWNIAFGIAPHINAVGRMQNAEEAVRLLLTDDEQIAEEQVNILKECNQERKRLQEKSFQDCLEMLDGTEQFIVLLRDDIHEGIGGIVAGKIKEERGRPCIILTHAADGRIKGTGRSIETVDLYDFLKEFAELFDAFGGHKGACGFTMKPESLEPLVSGIREKISKMAGQDPDLFQVDRHWDLQLEPSEISLELAEEIRKLEPFGQDNPEPVFLIEDQQVSGIRWLGSEGQHVRFQAAGQGWGPLNCILFQRGGQFQEILTEGSTVSLIGKLDTNTWNGHTSVQFKVEEIFS